MIVLSMGYGIVKVPRLLLASRSYKIKKAWCFYSVSEHEEMKFEKFMALEKYVCIINAWKAELQGKDNKMSEYRNLKSVEHLLENNLFVTLSKRGKLNKEFR